MDNHEVRTRVGDALADAFQPAGEMVTRWVLVAEVLDASGERAAWCVPQEGSTAWDTLGLLRFGEAQESAAIVAQAVLRPDDEDS